MKRTIVLIGIVLLAALSACRSNSKDGAEGYVIRPG